jgi:LCP family protein required for cell wall assembly
MAYYFGGGPLLIQTIKENFGIDIDNYAAVDFYALQDIIDSIGGITIDISADEVSVANHYITDMCLEAGMDVSNYLIQGSGSLHLNGLQAVGYCRIRYVGNGEAERTERQRRVLMTIISELKTRSLSEVDNFLNAALPHVTHNISAGKLSSLLMSVPSYLNYPIVSNRAPFTGRYSYIYADNGVLMLLPDYDYTIKKLYEIIYY